MPERIIGKVGRIVGPVIEAREVVGVEMLELVFVGSERLVGEVVRIRDKSAWIQVYEDTSSRHVRLPMPRCLSWSSSEPNGWWVRL